MAVVFTGCFGFFSSRPDSRAEGALALVVAFNSPDAWDPSQEISAYLVNEKEAVVLSNSLELDSDRATVAFRGLVPGTWRLSVSWTDGSGRQATLNETIEIPPARTVSKIIQVPEAEWDGFHEGGADQPHPYEPASTGVIYGRLNYEVPSIGSASPVADIARSSRARHFFVDIPLHEGREETGGERVLVKFRSNVKRLSSPAAVHISKDRQITWLSDDEAVLEVPPDIPVEAFIDRLLEEDEIRWVEPDYVYRASSVPSDPLYPEQWHHNMLGLPAAWKLSKGDPNIKVAVLDTGIAYHEDLKGNLLPGWNAVDGTDDPVESGRLARIGSHGTHVAGILGAVTDNGLGVSGVAWHVGIVPVKVLNDNGRGRISDIAAGIRWAVDHAQVDVINMSFGGEEYSRSLHEAVKYAADHGVVLVASVGNDANRGVLYPAAFDEVIAVGAVHGSCCWVPEVADYSAVGPQVELVAPGGGDNDILSTNYNRLRFPPLFDYEANVGTSMAAPQVSGVIALMLAAGIDPTDVRALLQETAIDLAETGRDEKTGYGMVNAYAAVSQAPISRTRVVAHRKDGTFLGPIARPVDRSYLLNGITSDERFYITAWIDVDSDGMLSAGDYLGVAERVELIAGQFRSVDLNLAVYDPMDPPLEDMSPVERAIESMDRAGIGP